LAIFRAVAIPRDVSIPRDVAITLDVAKYTQYLLLQYCIEAIFDLGELATHAYSPRAMSRRSSQPALRFAPLPTLEQLARNHPGWLDEAISPKEAARIVGWSPQTLATRRSRGGAAPRFLKAGGKVNYTRRSCFEFLARCARRTTSDEPLDDVE
jgi:hypothetical protein